MNYTKSNNYYNGDYSVSGFHMWLVPEEQSEAQHCETRTPSYPHPFFMAPWFCGTHFTSIWIWKLLYHLEWLLYQMGRGCCFAYQRGIWCWKRPFEHIAIFFTLCNGVIMFTPNKAQSEKHHFCNWQHNCYTGQWCQCVSSQFTICQMGSSVPYVPLFPVLALVSTCTCWPVWVQILGSGLGFGVWLACVLYGSYRIWNSKVRPYNFSTIHKKC